MVSCVRKLFQVVALLSISAELVNANIMINGGHLTAWGEGHRNGYDYEFNIEYPAWPTLTKTENLESGATGTYFVEAKNISPYTYPTNGRSLSSTYANGSLDISSTLMEFHGFAEGTSFGGPDGLDASYAGGDGDIHFTLSSSGLFRWNFNNEWGDPPFLRITEITQGDVSFCLGYECSPGGFINGNTPIPLSTGTYSLEYGIYTSVAAGVLSDSSIAFSIQAVPLPASLWLFLCGGVLLILIKEIKVGPTTHVLPKLHSEQCAI